MPVDARALIAEARRLENKLRPLAVQGVSKDEDLDRSLVLITMSLLANALEATLREIIDKWRGKARTAYDAQNHSDPQYAAGWKDSNYQLRLYMNELTAGEETDHAS